MVDFIAKYWIEVLFGLICMIAAGISKHFWKLQKGAIKNQIEKIQEINKGQISAEFKDLLIERDAVLTKVVNENHKEFSNFKDVTIEHYNEMAENFEVVKTGLLSIQGVQFKKECREILAQPTITTDDWEYITQEWNAYKSLGGNHDGDALYHMIQEKYKYQLLNNKNGED